MVVAWCVRCERRMRMRHAAVAVAFSTTRSRQQQLGGQSRWCAADGARLLAPAMHKVLAHYRKIHGYFTYSLPCLQFSRFWFGSLIPFPRFSACEADRFNCTHQIQTEIIKKIKKYIFVQFCENNGVSRASTCRRFLPGSVVWHHM